MKKYLLILITLLTGCGQIGPLYMPDDPNPPVHVPKAESEKPASKPTNTESEKN